MEGQVPPHSHKADRIEEIDLIPDPTVFTELPITAEEGRIAVKKNGSNYEFYKFLDGDWRPFSGITLPIDQSDVTDLVADLAALSAAIAGKADTAHTHGASDIVSGTMSQARLGTGSGGAGTKVLYDDQTYKDLPSTGSKVAVVTTDVEVNNSTAETDILSVTLPGGTLGTNNAVKITLLIKQLLGHNTSDQITLRLKYEGSTVVSTDLIPQTQVHQGFYTAFLMGDGATNAQEGNVYIELETIATTTSGSSQHLSAFNDGAGVIDSTTDQNLKVTAQWDVAELDNSIIVSAIVVERIT